MTNHHRGAAENLLYSKYLPFFMSEVCAVDSTWAAVFATRFRQLHLNQFCCFVLFRFFFPLPPPCPFLPPTPRHIDRNFLSPSGWTQDLRVVRKAMPLL